MTGLQEVFAAWIGDIDKGNKNRFFPRNAAVRGSVNHQRDEQRIFESMQNVVPRGLPDQCSELTAFVQCAVR